MARLNLDNPDRPLVCVDLNGVLDAPRPYGEALNAVMTFKAHWE